MNGPVRMYEQLGFCLYLVERKEGRAPIGICGLVKRDSLEDVDIGFAFRPKYWSKGYAYEAASAVMSYGKDTLGLTRIVAITTQENQASTNLLEKLGFRFERLIQMTNDSEELKLLVFDETENHIKKQWESSETKEILDRLSASFFDAFTNENGYKLNVHALSELFIPEAMII